MKNKKGFTLIELLSVMIILAVILVIAVPRILGVIESSKLNSFESSARMIISDAEKQYEINKVNGSEDVITCENTSKLNDIDYSNCEISISSGEGMTSIILVGSGKFDGLTCTGDSTTLTCGKNLVTYTDEACFTFDSGTGTITGYSSECEKDVKIPLIIGGELVMSIGDNAFRNLNLTSVIIPDSVTSIGKYAFYRNNIKSIIIPDSVTSIGMTAFQNSGLTSVIIGNGVTSIGTAAFYNNRLTSVTIGNSVTSIGECAFEDNDLTSITIPNSVKSIGKSAFRHNNLTSVIISNSVTSMGRGAFNDNQLPDNKAFIYKRNSDGSEDVTTLVSYGGARRDDVTIPNSVISIENDAFRENKLISVTIGSNVTSIGTYAFYKTNYSNSSLTTIANKTGKSFNWGNIINGSTGYNFVTGTVVNSAGNVSITSE